MKLDFYGHSFEKSARNVFVEEKSNEKKYFSHDK